ncbi:MULTISPECIES: pentapeptide repeat-containing protein [Gordonibacter]|uniref:Pentapeptide repeat-containing protein n=1 Tax=Gordonibacter faecis TaxID=3047475 RepID=A0ABT7DSN4_9ACTN|nr:MULTISPECIES: pentapeptide repeat-containing protein [unclassified Gordonibacter]MDJ1651185.1 pentapeptide repeat-containing protein [Gordonibacter sp. KGMB12511]HIW77349.1 pentapeptide repeat-containing protein [Candidatus Gordonibacter avicola]
MSGSAHRAPAPAAPAVPTSLVSVASLVTWIRDEGEGDPFAAHIFVAGDDVDGADFALLELSESRVENCRFAACDCTRAAFTDVVFSGCDFSNSDFSEANFTRCTFASCKFTGANFTEAVLRRVEVRDSTLAYASLAKAKLEDVGVRTTDLSHADVSEMRLKRAAFDDVRFVGTSFFRTSLDGVDLTTCQLADIVLSDTMGELRGCTMDLYQAAGIAQRLGVRIAD